MSCCRTLLVVISLFLSIFFFLYGLLLFVRSKNDQVNTSRQSNESSHEFDHLNESVIHVSAYMPDAKALKYISARNISSSSQSYTFKVSADFLRREFGIFFSFSFLSYVWIFSRFSSVRTSSRLSFKRMKSTSRHRTIVTCPIRRPEVSPLFRRLSRFF